VLHGEYTVDTCKPCERCFRVLCNMRYNVKLYQKYFWGCLAGTLELVL